MLSHSACASETRSASGRAIASAISCSVFIARRYRVRLHSSRLESSSIWPHFTQSYASNKQVAEDVSLNDILGPSHHAPKHRVFYDLQAYWDLQSSCGADLRVSRRADWCHR